MTTFSTEVILPVSAAEAFAWHQRPGAFTRLTPPGSGIRTLSGGDSLHDGERREISLPIGPLRMRWMAHHTGFRQDEQFCDEQERGPFARYVHTHRFRPDGEHRCVLEDRIDYDLPLGMLGRMCAGRLVDRRLRRLFAFRHRRTIADITRHHAVAEHGRRRIAISGASGLIGSALTAFLSGGGHRVHALVRRQPRAASDEISWDPTSGRLDTSVLAGCDAVVHLGGCPITRQRWTSAFKQEIRSSRIEPTRRLCTALAAMPQPPAVLLCASGTGWYGSRGDELLDETASAGSGFLGEVCRDWEEATAPARDAGIRVVRLRTGLVLSADGGALATMLIAFRLGLAGRLGSGRQWMSWISLDDWIGALHHLLFAAEIQGPVNLVSPYPCTNAEFTATLARAVHRPAVLPMPSWVVRALFGEMGQSLLLDGVRLRPGVLEHQQFAFRTALLSDALGEELK